MVEDRRVREERAYEIEKLRITQVADISLLPSGSGENFRPVKNMKYVMQKYDPENSDMVLFLTLFERQARKAKIEETKKLDDYETSRRFAKKSVAYRPPEKKVVEEPGKYGRPRIDNKARNERSGVNNWKGTPGRDLNWRDREFERRRPAACYQCGSTDHLRPQCPELRRQNTERVNNINSVGKFGPVFTPYLVRVGVCIDTVGPLPCSGKGNRHLVTALCVASKYPEAVPVADIRSETVTDALLLIFSRWGFPKVLQCDNGTSFTSNLTSTFFEKFGIRVVHSSVRHPQSNSVERWHRTLKRLLKALCVESGKDWEKILPAALLALRTVTHETTGFSPAELVHGKNLRTPETLIFEQWVEPPEGECAVTEYVFELINRMKQCQELASARAAEVRDKRKVYYDRGSVNRKFRPGDRVLVLAASRPNKLAVQWVGPGTIESQLSDTNYVVKLPGRTEKKPHISQIPYPSANPNIFDFEDIARSSDLFERYTEEQIEQLGRLLGSHRSIFSNEPGRTNLIEHDIHLISDQPVRSRPYRTSPRQNEILRGEIKRMLDLKIIEIGESDYTSPMILVEAPGKDPRPCIDYRKLNSIIRMEIFPLPNIEDRVERVCAANFISVIDLTKGYWQIPLTARAQRLAAFVTTFGTYRPLVLPFGLVNAPFGFSKFMSQLLQGCEEYSVPYLDDVAIFSNTWEDHLKHLDEVLKRVEPLTRALKGKNRKEKIEWTEECEKAVKVLKQKLTDRPVLYAPDFTKEFIVQTDASDIGIGVVLAQKGEKDLDHPVLYLS
ncbi:hypothetical protein JTE90_014137, partial [Oedothorax gibbosus]